MKSTRLQRILFSIILFHSTLFAHAQDIERDSVLIIGVKEAPPFVIKTESGFSGLSIDFWNLVNEDLGLAYEFRGFENLSDLIQSVEDGKVDLSINPITVTDQRMTKIDFSQPFFITQTVIARQKRSELMVFLRNFFSWKFFSALGILIAVIMVFGVLVWFFERKRNPEEFGGGLKGIGQGFWWSAVTMTTVGYGDKSPVTFGGRVIGFVWMFLAIILISGLTAGIASSLTVQSINSSISSVEDLKKFSVGVIESSSANEYLDLFNIRTEKFTTAEDALQELNKGNIDYFVYDRPILQYNLKNMGLESDIVILPKGVKTDYYSFSYPKSSAVKGLLDPVLVKSLKSKQWSYILEGSDR